MNYAYPIVGRTGLCNMLFSWAHAAVYCNKTGARMIAPKWTNFIRLGPWIRGERDKRYYLNSFTNMGYASRLLGLRTNWIARKLLGVKVFNGMAGFFDDLIDSHDIVVEELRKIVHPTIVRLSDNLASEDYIGVHVRRGDFVTNGQWISDDWYVNAIARAKELVGDLPIYLFSDGNVAELRERIKNTYPSVWIMPSAPAIKDVLTLSHSKCVVATSRSSFSMWAVYLGQMPSIWSSIERPPRLYIKKDLGIII